MKCLVTGAAGFIGSHLCERLVNEGHDVIGFDAFTDSYARAQKEANLVTLRSTARFLLIEADLVDVDLAGLLTDVEYVFHLAGQPGVRASWGSRFESYLHHNVLTTQKLLEAAQKWPLKKLVYASSSSVYGAAESFPTPETARPQPVSPYGVSKLAAEHLCYLYWKNYGIPIVVVRYFTVYGPRQRPDMAFHRFIRAILKDQALKVYGDGEQTRDFTYISDAVAGTLQAAWSPLQGEIFNLGGGHRITVNQVLQTLCEITGREIRIDRRNPQAGDVRHTGADSSRARLLLDYVPRIKLTIGLRHQLAWLHEYQTAAWLDQFCCARYFRPNQGNEPEPAD